MKNYHPCPNCFDRHPPIELPTFGIPNKPNIVGTLRCSNCGYIYRLTKDGTTPDFPKDKKYFNEVMILSSNGNLVDIFKSVEKNEGINITQLSRIMGNGNYKLGDRVSELERNRVLEVRYLGASRFLHIAKTREAELFKENALRNL